MQSRCLLVEQPAKITKKRSLCANALAGKLQCCMVNWLVGRTAVLFCQSNRILAKTFQLHSGLKVSDTTMTPSLQGLKHLRPKVVPFMTPKQRAARLSFARKAFRRDIVAWRNVRTDNSILRMHGKAGSQMVNRSHKGSSWQTKAQLRRSCVHGHDLPWRHHPQDCHWHPQAAQELCQSQDQTAPG